MKLTITTLTEDLLTMDVSDDLELENFKALCESETGIATKDMVILFEGRPLLEAKKCLKDYGLKDNDIVLMQQMPAQSQPVQAPRSQLPFPIDFSKIEVPSSVLGEQPSENSSTSTSQIPLHSAQSEDPAYIRQMFLSNPDKLAMLKQNNPRLAEALLNNDLKLFDEIRKEQMAEKAEKDRQRIRMMNADPFDAEAQQMIAEEIRLKNIDVNMETAMEYHPESFGQVIMLYIDCRVNGHPVKAFIDSGAQTTIMSQACAERCSIMRLVDVRWAGIAKGVGTQKIIGRVHLGQIQIGSDYLTSSFSILEDQPMDMLLGLDMLKRHQCSIDLKMNVLTIGTTGTETPFLSESDLPECARQLQIPSVGGRLTSEIEVEDKQLADVMNKSVKDAAASSSSDSIQRTSAGDKFSEQDIIKMQAMGFERSRVIEELRNANGDVTKATAALFARSFKF